MEIPHQCPLSPIKIQHSWWELRDLLEIEKHITTQPNCQHPQLNTWILPEPAKGSTPLLMACDIGNLESVKHIVEKWEADVNATGVYYYQYDDPSFSIKDGLDEASPLFVAAYKGHFSIVRYLLEKGARLDVKTSFDPDEDHLNMSKDYDILDGLNPLHGALCSLEHSERLAIIRLLLESGADPSALTSHGSPSWTMRNCGSDEVTLLIAHGMSLTQRCKFKKRTVLHYWASEFPHSDNSVKVVQLLLDKGADLHARDAQNLTPYLAAAQSFDENHECTSLLVLDFLTNKEEIDRMEKIDALELAGAVILSSQHPSSSSTARAFGYWRLALLLRGTCPKQTLVLKTVPYTEWTSETDLEDFENHPTRQKINSFQVQLRIYSCISWEAFEEFFQKFHEQPRFSYDLEHNFSTASLPVYETEQAIEEYGFVNGALDFWWILLEAVYQRFDIRQEKAWSFATTLIQFLVDTHLEYFEDPHLNSLESWKKSLKLIVKKNLTNLPTDTDHNETAVQFHLKTLHQLFSILIRLPAEILNDEEVMLLLKKLVSKNFNALRGNNLLLLYMTTHYFPYNTNANRLSIVDLLLKSGADPNSFDSAHNSPLHILLLSGRDFGDTGYDNRTLAIADLLLKSGADPNAIDGSRRSPLHILLLLSKERWDTSYAERTLALVDLLLKAGADPNSMDNKRNCPLHLLAVLQDEELDPVGRLLRDAGTHLDRVNQDEWTAAGLWFLTRDEKERLRGVWRDLPWEWNDLPDWCREDDAPNLSCLCAKIVHRYGIPYKHELPVSVSAFVEIHGP